MLLAFAELSGSESGVRAVSDKQGNLYVGQVNADYAHGGFDMALGIDGLNIYDVKWGITWQRIRNTNKFGLADSSAGYPSLNRKDKIFQANMEAVSKQHPNFEFIPEIYFDINEIVNEEIQLYESSKGLNPKKIIMKALNIPE